MLTPQLDADYIRFATGETINADFSVSHELGRVPVELFVLARPQAAIVYRGSIAWTSTTISLRSDTVAVLISALLI